MVVFDNTVRVDARIIQHGESQYAFLNRCSDETVCCVREFVDDLAQKYENMHGAASYRKVMNHFRSVDDGQHHGGYFELLMNHLLVRAGCKVKAIEPTLTNGSKTKPDFLVEGPNGQDFYLETRVVTWESHIPLVGNGDALPKVVNPEPAIRARILEKMPRYGDPGLPMILAVNTLDTAADRLVFEDVLLGTFGIQVALLPDGSTVQRVARGLEEGVNDAILAEDSAENVSAFLFMRYCRLGNEPNVWYCLYHNPRARRPLRTSLPVFYRAIPKQIPGTRFGYWHYRDGVGLDQLLSLPSNWPHDWPAVSDITLRRLNLLWSQQL